MKTRHRTTIRAVLLRAAKRLMEHGWTSGAFINEHGRCCALGAINLVTSGSAIKEGPGAGAAVRAVTSYIKVFLTDWNDGLPRRTARRQVVAAFRRVAFNH